MRRLIPALLLFFTAASLFAVGGRKLPAPRIFGTVQYADGSATVTRDGQKAVPADIGDKLYSDDLVSTSADCTLIIEVDKSTNMTGTVTVRPRTALYLSSFEGSSGSQNSIDLLSGSISAKVKKVAGFDSRGRRVTMTVRTNSMVAGVRGTEFDVSTSVNDATLVTCSEGSVTCSDGNQNLPVNAGKALEKRPDERFNYLPVSVSSLKEFRESWNTKEIEAFKSDPVRALSYYEQRYTDLYQRFKDSFMQLAGSATLKNWIAEHSKGIVPNPRDPKVMREKKEVSAQIFSMQKILFNYERIYYRMQEVQALIENTTLENRELRPGYKAGEFIRRVQNESRGLAESVALCRFAEKLYQEREEPGAQLFGSDSDGSQKFSD